MKVIYTLFLISFFTVFISCSENKKKEEKNITITKTEVISSNGVAKSTASIGIEGMTCSIGCAKKIENTLNETAGIVSAKVLFEDKVAEIEFDDSKISEENMIQIIEELGDYKVNKVEVQKTVLKSKSHSTTETNEEEKTKKKQSIKSVSSRSISFPNIFDVLTRLYQV